MQFFECAAQLRSFIRKLKNAGSRKAFRVGRNFKCSQFMKTFFVCLAFFAILIANFGCKKELNENFENENFNFGMDSKQIHDIGTLHNKNVQSIISLVEPNSKSFLNEIRNVGLDLGPIKNNKRYTEYLIKSFNTNTSINLNSYLQINKYPIKLYQKLINMISSNNNDLNQFHKKIDKFILEAQKIESKRDKEFILICASVAKSSSRLWFSKNIGGEGYFDELNKNRNIENKTDFDNLEQRYLAISCQDAIVAADVAGAAYAVSSLAYLTILGVVPGINAIIAAEIAGQAAIWSTIAYATHNSCKNPQ